MQKWNGRLDKLVDGIGWGLFFILIGVLFLAENQGWLKGGWWEIFAIGLGSILLAGFLARYFAGNINRWKPLGGLLIGLALIYTGSIFLSGLGNWWPLALLPIGIGFLVKAIWGAKSTIHNPDVSM
jgi:hypothetical protein